jgi:cytochrome c oxidase subunit 1
MRAPGMTWFRLPLFVWAHYATSLIMVLGTPVIAITLLLVAVERAVRHFGIFDPALGGDPVLFQHLFWFYSHPAVYIMILPAMGVISELVAPLLAQAGSSATVRRVLSLAIAVSASSCGATTCSSPASRSTPALIFSFLSFSSRSRRRSRSSTGRRRCTRARSRGRRRCSTPSASSACSRSAA